MVSRELPFSFDKDGQTFVVISVPYGNGSRSWSLSDDGETLTQAGLHFRVGQ